LQVAELAEAAQRLALVAQQARQMLVQLDQRTSFAD